MHVLYVFLSGALASDLVEQSVEAGSVVLAVLALLACCVSPLLFLQEADLRVSHYTGSEAEQFQAEQLLKALMYRPQLLVACFLLKAVGMATAPLLLSPFVSAIGGIALTAGILILADVIPYMCWARRVRPALKLLPLARLVILCCFPLACLFGACVEQEPVPLSCQDLTHLLDLHSLAPKQNQALRGLLRAKKESAGAHMTALARCFQVREEDLQNLESLKKLAKGQSRVAVVRGENIVGVVLMKELLQGNAKLQTPLFVPYDTSLPVLLQRLSLHGGDLAVITSSVERHITVMGVITLQQALRALLGVTS